MQKYKGKIMPARRHSGYAYPINAKLLSAYKLHT